MVRRKDRPPPASILPGYRDMAEIGGGAFATVYRATEADTGRQVALKILKVDAVHPRLMETFAREIEALAKVSDHPNIVTLYRPLATPDGRPVLVLELGRESLAQQIRRTGPIGARDVTRIGIKIAGALETAHRHGFLHRDMKPQKILVTQFGEPALGDFGVAALQASAQATAGVFGFTTLHAAPEILEGHRLSPATDVYGLASTMYHLLAGMAPFATFDNEAPASVILRIIRDPVRPLRTSDIPIGLSDLIEAALSKDPEGRPQSALEFADALLALETSAGWTPTAYVAWGRSDMTDSPVAEPAPARPSMPLRAPQSVPLPAAPSLPLPPPGAATLPGAARLHSPAVGPSRPSVAPPPAAARHVITPDRSARGLADARQPPPAGLPVTPLRPIAEGSTPVAEEGPARPTFLDPPGPVGPDRLGVPSSKGRPLYRSESVYEQIILPTRSSEPDDEPAPSPVHALLVSPLLLGGIAAAAAVVVAAILVIFGIL